MHRYCSDQSIQQFANVLRVFSADMIETAGSGHPGAALGMAEMAAVLWQRFLKYSPTHPAWFDRDRFVLSNGHASALLYAMLHLVGYPISTQELSCFRQLGSQTPGHPEYGVTPGVDTTTGPLGQGFAHAVGMAIAERVLAARFNRPNHEVVNHRTYVFMGDGCLMEGISHEVASLAGTLKLGKLIGLYDANNISIDGSITPWFSEEVSQRFTAYGWHVQTLNGHDVAALSMALEAAIKAVDQPSLLICQTIIGQGAPTQSGSSAIHGKPLGHQELQGLKAKLNWKASPFQLEPDLKNQWDHSQAGEKFVRVWEAKREAYAAAYPSLADELDRLITGELPEDWRVKTQQWIHDVQAQSVSPMATRQASQESITVLTHYVPELFGGSADLTPSNLTYTPSTCPVHKTWTGNYLHYGVREFGMTAILVGIAVHGGLIPFGGTFLAFSDYASPALRLAALMRQRILCIYTHDSIGVGEDGPTHQPIEQHAHQRQIPNLATWRPCDSVETAVAWVEGVSRRTGPTSIFLSRQAVPAIQRSPEQVDAIKRGGYLLRGSLVTPPELLLLSSGSEVQLVLAVYEQLVRFGHAVAVISMPSPDQFDRQDQDYKAWLLPSTVTKRLAVEAGWSDFWYKYVGLSGAIVGMKTFGASGKAKDLYQHFAITVEAILERALCLLKAV